MSLVNAFRWAVTVLFGAAGLSFIVMNCALMVDSVINRNRHSLVPLVGGALGCAALLICPVGRTYRWAWLPLVIDVGGLLVVALTLHVFVRRKSPR